jgi:hypothetical protein
MSGAPEKQTPEEAVEIFVAQYRKMLAENLKLMRDEFGTPPVVQARVHRDAVRVARRRWTRRAKGAASWRRAPPRNMNAAHAFPEPRFHRIPFGHGEHDVRRARAHDRRAKPRCRDGASHLGRSLPAHQRPVSPEGLSGRRPRHRRVPRRSMHAPSPSARAGRAGDVTAETAGRR